MMSFIEHLFDCCLTQTVIGIGIAAISIVIISRQRSKSRLAALRELWNSRGKDVVTLHMFDRALTAPNPSPFPIKLETYLRMAGIKYVIDFEEQMSSKGKSPWITVNGVDVEDSQLAIDYLTWNLKKDIESHLTLEQRSNSRALRIMIEEHFYWCLAMERWVINEAEDVPRVFAPTIYPSFVPAFVINFLYSYLGKQIIGKQARAAGIGRHSDEEIFKLGFEDLDSLSAWLGDKLFLMGDQPCQADLTLFGFICMLTCLPEDSRSKFKPHVEKNCKNLLDHHKRMVDKYWPDYETARYSNQKQGTGIFVDK